MSRIQLAINVTDFEGAIDFYSRLFDAEPAKVRPGYANFAIADPPLKLVLIEGGPGGTINHLGVEVETVEEVRTATGRFEAQGLPTEAEKGVCCYAEQDKVWVTGPEGDRWEVYTVLGDADHMSGERCCPEGCCTEPALG